MDEVIIQTQNYLLFPAVHEQSVLRGKQGPQVLFEAK